MDKFPFYSQLDMMDCGPACLRMIAKYYGNSYSLEMLRSHSFISREGVSMLGISDAAEYLGMHTLGVKISFEQLANEAVLPYSSLEPKSLRCMLWHQEEALFG